MSKQYTGRDSMHPVMRILDAATTGSIPCLLASSGAAAQPAAWAHVQPAASHEEIAQALRTPRPHCIA